MATARFLARQTPRGTAYVIGEGGLLTALHENGYSIVDRDPDYVVVGEGRTISFEMVEAALEMILKGRSWSPPTSTPTAPPSRASAPAVAPPWPCWRRPVASRHSASGNRAAICFGEHARSSGLTTDQTVVIGDTMETDILGGVQLGFKTILVLSGGTNREDLDRYAYQPDRIVESIADLDHTDLIHGFSGIGLPPRIRTNGRKHRGAGPLLRPSPTASGLDKPPRQR